MTPQEFDALAERLLHSVIRKSNGYTPPESAHMLVDTALAIAEDFVKALAERRVASIESSELTLGERNVLVTGDKISVIRMVRERLGLNLKDAKSFVDKAEAKL